MVMGDTRLCPWDGGTNGSRSIKYFGPALRAAGAEAREVLIQLAADRLTLPAARLAARDGFVVDRTAPGTRVAYGTLVKGTPSRPPCRGRSRALRASRRGDETRVEEPAGIHGHGQAAGAHATRRTR